MCLLYRPLGPIQYVLIWHDNNGVGKFQGWYCSYIIITDLQTREKFIFLINKWFAVEEDDGQVGWCLQYHNSWLLQSN